ncbi:GNAT family N-acetyltransferase [Stenotrophomonas sp.]|uniref:GNAT family N-acetyltransferase n=1 Tax=Stenotrophomonas sp. TaxID=69392 RepID=UPI002FCBCA15
MNQEVQVEPLSGSHDVSDFDCGNESLSTWLKQHARQGDSKGSSRTHVLRLSPAQLSSVFGYGPEKAASLAVAGYFTLSASTLDRSRLQPRHSRGQMQQMPVILLGKLAIDHRLQGAGLGELLVGEAIIRAAEASRLIGAAGIFVEAIDDGAAAFYRKCGFQECQDDATKLWLPMPAIYARLSEMLR